MPPRHANCGGTRLRLCSYNCHYCHAKSFASHDRAYCWSEENEKSARQMFLYSNKDAWFDCDECSHTFQSRIADITKGHWCSFCANRQLCEDDECKLCLDKSFKSHEKHEFWSEELNEKKPREAFKSSADKFWFECLCGHNFETSLDHINNGGWCPYCANKKLCDEDCDTCFKKSFASHHKKDCWAEENTKLARQVLLGSGIVGIFNCDGCDHYFEKRVASVTSGGWCPYCANQELCDDDCEECYEKSFASHEKAEFWSEENEQKSRKVFLHSNLTILLGCSTCRHTFETTPALINDNCWCPFCSNHQLCADDNCELCLKKSFASHEKSIFWSEDNEQDPREVFLNARAKFSFDCNKCGHTFQKSLHDVNYGKWCPMCKNKTETALYDYLKLEYPETEHHPPFDWCINPETNNIMTFDFQIDNILIELDGPQHYRQVSNWESPKDIQKRDRLKEELAMKNGYMVIRILQEDVRFNRCDWKSLLERAIKLRLGFYAHSFIIEVTFKPDRLFYFH
jgi:hypothetical protein